MGRVDDCSLYLAYGCAFGGEARRVVGGGERETALIGVLDRKTVGPGRAARGEVGVDIAGCGGPFTRRDSKPGKSKSNAAAANLPPRVALVRHLSFSTLTAARNVFDSYVVANADHVFVPPCSGSNPLILYTFARTEYGVAHGRARAVGGTIVRLCDGDCECLGGGARQEEKDREPECLPTALYREADTIRGRE